MRLERLLVFTFVTLGTSLPALSVAQDSEGDSGESGVDISFQPGDGLVVQSRDDQFALSIRPRAQILAELRYPEAADGFPGDVYVDAGDVDLGVSIRRARVTFEGWFFGRGNRFKLELGFSPQDLGFVPDVGPTRTPLMDWYVDLRHLRDLQVRVGQYKLPFNRERVISAGDLQLVDRSLANAELALDRDLGIDLRSRDFLGLGLLRYYVGIATGEGRDAGFGNDLGFTYFARIEVLPLGMFDDYTEADLERRSRPGLSIGAAYAFLDEAPRLRGSLGPEPFDQGTTDYHTFTADVMFKWAGFSFFGEAIWREGSRNPGMAVDDMGMPQPVVPPSNGVGWFVQAGYLLPGIDLEFAARYGMLHPLGDAATTSFPERGELGGGVSYYFGGHSYKLQLDYFHLWSDDDFGDAEEQVRLQLQGAL